MGQGFNKPYVKLVGISNKRGVVTATVELDVMGRAGSVQRKEVVVQDGDDLEQTTGREIYANMRVGTLRAATKGGKGGPKTEALMELHVPGGQQYLTVDESWGGVEPLAVQREMIRRTIKEHLDKEKRLRPMGVKVLSLFFIDAVDKYRVYDAEGNPQKGVYATIFEEEYKRWAQHPDYRSLFNEIDLSAAAHEVHNGYFSIDKKKVAGKVVEMVKDTSGSTAADDDTYNLIMRDKEKLLSFSSPLKFIFSHSALKEGWDNPNVFQICNFSARQTERWRRQTIGRGLRLCVNQDGLRLRGFEVNTLTVKGLGLLCQRERCAEIGVRGALGFRGKGDGQQFAVEHGLLCLVLRPTQVGQRDADAGVRVCEQHHRVGHRAVQQLHQATGLAARLQRQVQHSQFQVLAVVVLVGRHADQVRLESGQPDHLVYAILNLASVGGRGHVLLGQQLLGHALVQPGGFRQTEGLDQVVNGHAGAAAAGVEPGSTTR